MIWWQVYPLGFTGAHPGGAIGRTLRYLEPWLDYAIELGCSGLALGPVFESESHGYDTIDHFRIDPRLGAQEDFDSLVTAAHDRGMRVLLDGVFNHVGRGHAQFQAALEAGPESEAARWFRLQRREPEPVYEAFEGHEDLINLNHSEPSVADYVSRVMEYWLDRGADGWRLDAAYAVPVQFWQTVTGRVRDRRPEAWFLAEVLHGDYAEFAAESGVDSVTQYELWKATWSSLNDVNFFELAWAIERHDGFAEQFLPLTFVGNHDVTRLASVLNDPRHIGHALAILFTIAGIPSVYYGDEQAFQGVKEERFGGDDAVRPEFPASAEDLAPFGWPTYRLHQELIALRRRHRWLTCCSTTQLHLTNAAFAYRSTARDGDGSLTVLLNLSDDPVRFPVDLGGTRTEAESGRADDPALVDGHGWRILVEAP